MILFWSCIAIMTLLALGFVVWPLLPIAQTNNTGARLTLDNKWLLLMLVIALPVAAGLLYRHWGAADRLNVYYQQQKNAQLVQQTLKQLGTAEQVIAKLKAQLQQHPTAKGWYLLGRLYLSQEQLAQAQEAFANSHQLNSHDPQTMLQYAEVLFLQERHLTAQARELLEQVLSQQPDNAEAINILAIADYQQGNYPQAIQRWEQLLTRFPADTEDGKKLLEAIARAQAALKQARQAEARIHIPVQVEIAAAIFNQVKPTDTVFIYAQAAQGPKMPLAIIRKQVQDLPLSVTLDETMAMLPTMTLDKVEKIRVVARISKSGQAMPQPGDWLGMSPVISTTDVPANLHIKITQQL